MTTVSLAATDQFLFARTADRVVGSMGVVPLPHGVGLVFPPEVDDGPDALDVRRLLIEGSVRRLAKAGSRFAQLVLPDDQRALAAGFVEAGFVRLTDAVSLERDLSLPLPAPAATLTAECCDPVADDRRLTALLQDLNRGSLDCPELDAHRTADEVFEGHRQAAFQGRSEWLVYRAGRDPIGAAIWIDCPDEEIGELLFFGVLPEARGRQFGRAILGDVLARCRPIRTRIRAASDSRNRYAIACYNAAGFSQTGVAGIWIHSLRRTS